jgi:cytoskeletal protein RodZ
MADFSNDRTVIVDRDRDTASPLGWVMLLVALLLIIAFFLSNGFGMLNRDKTNTTETQTAPTTSEPAQTETPTPTAPDQTSTQTPTTDTTTAPSTTTP